jgi:hypothetical protein
LHRPATISRFVPSDDSWSIADVLDFEVLLAADAAGDEAAFRRDRAMFVSGIEPFVAAGGPSGRRRVFRRWLEARRRAEPEAFPGGRFESGRRALQAASGLAGLAVGASVATALLHYRGQEPVNVAWFFAATIGVQWLALAASASFWTARRLLGSAPGPLRTAASALSWSLGAGLRRIPGEKRERLRALLATIEHRREIYRAVAVWPSVVVTQLFGVCFNVGVLATLLAHVALTDIGFGWQSTLRAGPEQAWRLVSLVATPWSFLPDAHPTLEQVIASRFSYSEGIAPLSREAMASWWPFLFCSVLVYGLLVRSLLLAWAVIASRSALARLSFDHAECHSLYRRLTGPVVHASAEGSGLVVPALDEPARAHAAGRCVVLVADGLAVSRTLLADSLRSQFGWEVSDVLPIEIDHPSGNASSLDALSSAGGGLASVVVAVPAQRAPIKAIALCLENVRAAAGSSETVVLLFGRPSGAGFAPVGADELANWRRFNAIHGLHVGLERWSPA